MFHRPWSARCKWDSFHSAWINTIVRHLNLNWLPPPYRAEPTAHLASPIEVDVGTWEKEGHPSSHSGNGNGVATAVWSPPECAASIDIDFSDEDTFEVRVLDEERGLRLVAAIELVSPGNKDRPAKRQSFAHKCVEYLRQGVSMVIIDVVTDRLDNLHHELLAQLERTEPRFWETTGPYAIAYRPSRPNDHWQIDIWPARLTIDAPMPDLPLWLSPTFSVPLELETTFQESWNVLRLG
jgi:hypothetical protein